jgi:hypothetical protein
MKRQPKPLYEARLVVRSAYTGNATNTFVSVNLYTRFLENIGHLNVIATIPASAIHQEINIIIFGFDQL